MSDTLNSPDFLTTSFKPFKEYADKLHAIIVLNEFKSCISATVAAVIADVDVRLKLLA